MEEQLAICTPTIEAFVGAVSAVFTQVFVGVQEEIKTGMKGRDLLLVRERKQILLRQLEFSYEAEAA